MFTGIVKGLLKVEKIERKPNLISLGIVFKQDLLLGLQIGASVAIDGACLSVTKIDMPIVWFDVIQETLNRTTLKFLEEGHYVNVERSATFGDTLLGEIGGHILTGHIWGIAYIEKITRFENNTVLTFRANPEWMKYFFPKGYIALDGISLTLVDVFPDGHFTVHLIPETLRTTKFGSRKEGDGINVELEAQIQAVVDTVERKFNEYIATLENRLK